MIRNNNVEVKSRKAKKLSYYHAMEFHKKRPARQRKTDEARTAKNTTKYPTEAWFKNPASSDVRNIDTKKGRTKRSKETETGVMPYFRKNRFLLLIITGMFIFIMFIILSPALADLLMDIGEGIKDGFSNLIDFFRGVFS